jgi:hypothetical protein
VRRTYWRFSPYVSLARLVFLLSLLSLALCMPRSSQAKENCPWLNEATADGALQGPVTSTVTHPNNNKDDATCEFTRRDGSIASVLRIEVETIGSAPAAFAAYVIRCGQNSVPLKAIGNEAVACSADDRNKKGWISEQVVGRVRDRAFTVRISANAASPDRSVLREATRKIAEQVAGFLF